MSKHDETEELHTVINPRFAKRQARPSYTWKGARNTPWYAKVTTYGCHYKCAYCGKESHGIGGRMHWTGCPNRASAFSYVPKGDSKRRPGRTLPMPGKGRRS